MSQKLMPFPDHAYAKIKNAILGCEPVLARDVYAISFFIEDLDDDPRKPILILSYNTTAHWRKSIPHAINADDAKWNFAHWPQTCEAFVGDADDAVLREQWIASLDLWYDDQKADEDPELTLERGAAITRRFFALAVEISTRLHEEGVIAQKFARTIPILVHELEYYLEIAQFTACANPPDLTTEFSSWIESLYL